MVPTLPAEAIAATLAGAGHVVAELSASETIRAGRPGADDPGGDSVRWTQPPGSRPMGDLPSVTIADGEREGPDLHLRAMLGRGGMGEVWAARERTLDRVVAVKRLHPDASESTLGALLTEAKITARLDHANIVPIHFVAEDGGGAPVVVMKRVRGRPWSEHLAEQSAPPRGTALVDELGVLIAITRALEFAHAQGVAHRDIKPENVMVSDFGEVYLVDWGLAVVIEHFEPSHEIVGTAGYVAPEMVSAGPVDARTDVYLLGATLYRLLTGRMRHEAPTVVEALAHAALGLPVDYPDGVPEELAAICERACATEPADRHPTATAFREALESYVDRRAAFALLRGADSRCEALERAAASNEASEEGRLREVRSHFDQALLAYQQVLDGWPDLVQARHGHDRAVRAMLKAQARSPNPAGVPELFDRLYDPTDEDRALAEDARARADAVQHAARQADPKTGMRDRAFVGLLATGFGIFTSITIIGLMGLQTPSPTQLVYIILPVMAVYGLILLFTRRRLRHSLFNRMVTRTFGVGLVTMAVHRLLALQIGTPSSTTMTIDLLILGFSISGVAPVSRVAWPLTATCFAAAAIAAFAPAYTMTVFAMVVTVFPGVLAMDWLLRVRAGETMESLLRDRSRKPHAGSFAE